MKKSKLNRLSVAFWAFLTIGLAAATGHTAMTASPAETTFTLPDQSATVSLKIDGVPIPAKDILSWRFLASGHDYKHMIDVEAMDGAIKISPSKTLEIGSYDLEIATARGSVVVRVFAPLSDVPNIIEKTAALAGTSEQKAAEALGLTTTTGREKITLALPPVYYEGQTLEVSLAAKPVAGHTCTWFMNGDAIAKGPEQHAISYTFEEPGEYVLTYVETVKENGALVTVALARANTRVVRMPGVATDTAVNTEIEYSPPAGYQKFVWRIDDREVSTASSLKHTFLKPGTHVVECLASSPDKGPAQGFQRVRYNTIVNPA